MTQPNLFTDVAPPAPGTKKGHVPRSSVLAYQALETKDQRVTDVVAVLERHVTRRRGPDPTSAELAHTCHEESRGGIWANVHVAAPLELVMWVRRGLSDAKQRGLVEHAGSRVCTVSGKTAITWKVCSR